VSQGEPHHSVEGLLYLFGVRMDSVPRHSDRFMNDQGWKTQCWDTWKKYVKGQFCMLLSVISNMPLTLPSTR
jgi:hypothetical protein